VYASQSRKAEPVMTNQILGMENKRNSGTDPFTRYFVNSKGNPRSTCVWRLDNAAYSGMMFRIRSGW